MMHKNYAEDPMKIRTLQLKNPIILAPMAGISDLPYRLIMKPAGAGLVFTEMVSAVGLVRAKGRNRTFELLDSRPEERPLGVQLFGSDPDYLAQGARLVASHADLIDLNLGCPVPKVTKGGGGSALLREPERIRRIVASMRAAWDGPLTIKIRSGWDSEQLNYLEIGRIAQEEGADAITLHPRTRSQGFAGLSDWTQLRRLKEALTIPVIGSGDIFTAEDGVRMLAETGCDAIMIGRGGYGNPWLLSELAARLQGDSWQAPTPAERAEIAHRHLNLSLEILGEKRALGEMRKHLCWYARGLVGAADFRQSINRAEEIATMRALIDAFFIAGEHRA
jgi:nifR3 family TIM-barrel protein